LYYNFANATFIGKISKIPAKSVYYFATIMQENQTKPRKKMTGIKGRREMSLPFFSLSIHFSATEK
jgi:hypothetical protein